MAAQDPIWSCAREDLVITNDRHGEDVFLWEHAVRVINSAKWIASQADVPGDRLDWAVLSAAALYHDAGWIVQLREGTIARSELLCRPASELQRDLAAGLMQKRLVKLLPRRALQRAADCIRLLHRRDHEVPEAQVLSDADDLDHVVGPLLIYQIVRGQSLEGLGVPAAVDRWNRRKEYGYFKTQIDGFHYGSARERAWERLKGVDQFVAEFARQHRGDDLGPPAPGDDDPEPTDRPPAS